MQHIHSSKQSAIVWCGFPNKLAGGLVGWGGACYAGLSGQDVQGHPVILSQSYLLFCDQGSAYHDWRACGIRSNRAGAILIIPIKIQQHKKLR